jgi:hypothetical protein
MERKSCLPMVGENSGLNRYSDGDSEINRKKYSHPAKAGNALAPDDLQPVAGTCQ